jgi:hypothetical protein
MMAGPARTVSWNKKYDYERRVALAQHIAATLEQGRELVKEAKGLK